MRDLRAVPGRAQTGDVLRPGQGTNVARIGRLASAAIGAPALVRARPGERETRTRLPETKRVAVTGGEAARIQARAGATGAGRCPQRSRQRAVIAIHPIVLAARPALPIGRR